MPEVGIAVLGVQPVTIRLESTDVVGYGSAAWPRLLLRFKIQLMLPHGQEAGTSYVLLRLAGKIETFKFGEIAHFDAGPLVEEPPPHPFPATLDITVDLDRARVWQYEEARSGADAQLNITFSGLAWLPQKQKFERVYSSGQLQIQVPRSHWVDQVVSRWGLSIVKMVEISFPSSKVGDNFRSAYAHVESAEKLFANGLYKQSLGELYSGFEGLAKSMGFAKPDQQFFAGVLAELHPTKKESAKRSLDSLCDFLHLGRHEAKEAPESFIISRSDARFALIMSQAVLEYVSPKV